MSNENSIYFYETLIGKIGIADNGNAITHICMSLDNLPNAIEQETPCIKQAIKEIREYLAGNRDFFDIKINHSGTEFQKKVWHALLRIPYGETRTYKEIAEMVGNPNASRAVGMANNRNPISIVIPCHRVIGTNKKLTGYAGGLDVKKKLLEIEKNEFLKN